MDLNLPVDGVLGYSIIASGVLQVLPRYYFLWDSSDSHYALAVEKDVVDEIKREFFVIQKDYTEDVMNHQRRLMGDLENKLRQQIWQTNAIAGMMFLMVLIGIWLSYLQFKRDHCCPTKIKGR